MVNSKVEKFEVVNTSGIEYIVCYDRVNGCFVVLESEDDVTDRHVVAPYDIEFRSLTWKIFYSFLNEEETILANSFDEKHGFILYLQDVGLGIYYWEAVEQAREKYFSEWEAYNNLSIDWNTVTIV